MRLQVIGLWYEYGRNQNPRSHGQQQKAWGSKGGLKRAEGRAWRKLETGIAKVIALCSDGAMQLEAPSSVWGGLAGLQAS